MFSEGFGSYFEYHTLNECLSLILELPDLTILEKITYKDYDGFKIKTIGRPSSGFIFREENDEVYLTGVVSGDKIIEAITENDMRELARIFLNYTNYVIKTIALELTNSRVMSEIWRYPSFVVNHFNSYFK